MHDIPPCQVYCYLLKSHSGNGATKLHQGPCNHLTKDDISVYQVLYNYNDKGFMSVVIHTMHLVLFTIHDVKVSDNDGALSPGLRDVNS